MKKGKILLAILISNFCINTGWCYNSSKLELNKKTIHNKGIITDKPADWWVLYWTGVGNLRDWTVSNTLQGGLFARPPTDSISKYDASYEQQTRMSVYYNNSLTRGKTGEYPADSQQYYVYEAGPWIGALYPVVDSSSGDTVWTPNLSRGAYQSDIGAMSIPELQNAGEAGDIGVKGLTFSSQLLPHGYTHEGNLVFKQPGMSKEAYQALWCFADTTINSRRPMDMQLDPAKGDIISNEDTYAVSGDWIPAEDAMVIWVNDIGPYGSMGLGIRVEQRTYSFNMPENKNYIYINYKIKNMNSFPLKNVYFGYFMDNDIGYDTIGGGCNDDLIGYDKTLNLGYSFDSDGYEKDWKTTAGYIGCILCETPGNIGFTGFSSWTLTDSLVDRDGQDSLKYEKLKQTTFCSIDTPRDVRQLSSSGPYTLLQPGEEVDFTIAVVCADNLTDLKKNAQNAITQFNNGYLPQCPIVNGIKAIPPVVNPGDSVTILAYSYDKDGIQTISADIESPDESLCTNIQLYDDGLHNDGSSNDHTYGNIWKTSSSGKHYFIDVFAKDNLGDTTLINNGSTFTTMGPLVIDNWQIQGSDTILSPNDSVNIEITIKNKGICPIYGILGTLTAPSYIKILDTTHILGTLDTGQTIVQNYKIKIFEDAYDTTVPLILTLRDSTVGEWKDTIDLEITDDKGPFLHSPTVISPLLSAGSMVILRATLIDGSGVDSVVVNIESPIGTTITNINFYDDGTHADILAGDNIYGNSWITPTAQEKFYNVNLTAKDKLGNKKQYVNLMEFTTKTFAKTATILVVDDDNYNRPPLGNTKPYEKYYTEALDANSYTYDVWDVFCYGSPDTSILNQYSIVIWLTGTTCDSVLWEPEYYNSTAFSTEEQNNINLYLYPHKGKLFLSSQGISDVGIFSRLGINKVITGINIDTVIGINGKYISNGLTFAIEGGTGANNQFMQSALKTGGPGVKDSIFKYKDYTGEGYAGVAFNYNSALWKTVTLPFGFEAIDLASTRNELMHRIVEWLLSPGVEDTGMILPRKYELFSNEPNPFKLETEIKYSLPEASLVELNVYNLLGQKVNTLVNKYETPGYKKVKLERKKLPSGVYFYKLKAGEFTATRKFVIMQ
ncbi:MAG: T9SS type A sorting domain-containing protein [bacterium]|nr:T9SS type A sorting domain-containing protein [bacterium]